MAVLETRDLGAARAIARGWRDGLRAMRRERAARTPSERREAARRLSSLREAIVEHRRLGRA
jgi:hypothetical protein